MSRFVNEINDSPLAAERAEKDILGNKIDTTYQRKLTAGSNISINEVTNTISAQVPPDFSSVIPSDATSSNKLVSTNTLDARLADFGGFKEVQGTGADLHPNVPSGEENSKLIYLVRDNSATGDDKYKEWIWDSGDPEANPPVSAQWKLIGDTTMHLDGYVQKVQIDGTEIQATSGTVNIPLAVADYYGTSATDGALSKEDKEKIDSYKYMYLSGGTSGEKIYANSPDLNLDVGFLTLGNTGFGQVPGFVAVGRAGQDDCFFGNQGSDPAFGVYDNQSQQFSVKELLTEDSYTISNLENGKADKVIGATSGNLAALDEDGNLYDSGKKAADFANVQSDWNQTDTSADDYIKNKPKTVLWLTYGSTYTKAQVDGWIADGYLLCVSYSSRTYKLGRATFYQDTNYYTFSDELDYVGLTINNSTSAWTDGTHYPTPASIGAAPSVHSHGNIASDGTDGEATHDTSRFLRGDGTWARLQLRSTLQSEANGYFRITCVAGSDCQHSSVYVFGSYNEYGYLYQVSFRYKNNQFSEAPRVRMITCNNETGLNYIPKAIKYGTGAAGTGYIFIQTNVVQRCTFLVTGNSPSSITIDTVTSTDSATSVSDGVKGHGSVHTEEYGTGTGSSTQPVYVDAGGGIVACSVSDSHYYGGNGVLPSVTAYAYVKSGTTLTVNVDNLIEDKTYTAQVVRASSGTASFNIKFQSDSAFNVYGHSQTTTNITTYTLSHSTYPMMFMRSGRNIYIIWY